MMTTTSTTNLRSKMATAMSMTNMMMNTTTMMSTLMKSTEESVEMAGVPRLRGILPKNEGGNAMGGEEAGSFRKKAGVRGAVARGGCAMRQAGCKR